jgi:hypothetical protein
MRREAQFVENMWLKGDWTDAVMMAILDREYRVQTTETPAGRVVPTVDTALR